MQRKSRSKKMRFASVFITLIFLAGCVSMPLDILKSPVDALEKRELQSRVYATTDEKKLIISCAAALQDMEFTIDDSETSLGVVLASKDRTAVSAGQVTAALMLDVLSAAAGSYSNAYGSTDKQQKIRASVVTRLSEDKSKIIVRAVFQQMVWNQMGQLSRVETLKDPQTYKGFYEKLSKSVFLEEQKI